MTAGFKPEAELTQYHWANVCL